MRLYLLLLTFVAGATAQLDKFLKELPACAITCILQHAPTSGCALTDIECVCQTPELWVDMEACVLANCTTKQGLTTQRVAADACKWPIRDKGMDVAVTGPLLSGIAFLFVVVRLFARQPAKSDLSGWDDIFVILAFIAGLPLAILDVLFHEYGLGQDIWRVPFDDITMLLKLFWVGEICYLTSTILIKIALLMFFLRVFPHHNFRLVTKIIIGLCGALWFSFFVSLLLQCQPISYAWLRWDGEHEGTCINVYVGGFMHAALNMLFDLIILILPLPLLYRLQRHYSWKQKSHMFIMFSFGLIVTIVCALRLNSLVTFGKSLNPTYDYLGAAVWSQVEVQVSIICACLPAARIFFAKLLPSWLGVTSKDSKTENSGPARPGASASKTDPSRAKSPGLVDVKVNQMSADGFTELVDMEEQNRKEGRNTSSWASPTPRAFSPAFRATDTDRHSAPSPMDQRDRAELDSYGITRS